jgi:hypothetical protein
MSEWVLKTLWKFEDFQAENEGSIPFTRSTLRFAALSYDLLRFSAIAFAGWSRSGCPSAKFG